MQLQPKPVGDHELQVRMNYVEQIQNDVSNLKELVVQISDDVQNDLSLARAQREEIVIAMAEFQEELNSKGKVSEATAKGLLDKIKSVKEAAVTSSSLIKLWEEIQKLI